MYKDEYVGIFSALVYVNVAEFYALVESYGIFLLIFDKFISSWFLAHTTRIFTTKCKIIFLCICMFKEVMTDIVQF